MQGQEQPDRDVLHIFVNKKKFETTATSLTGAQVLELAGLSFNEYDLFLVKGQGESERVNPDQEAAIRNGLHFNAIAKGVNFGGSSGA